MVKLTTAFLLAAALGAVVCAARPGQAYYRSGHAHTCVPVPMTQLVNGVLTVIGEYGDSRLFAKGGAITASCPIPEDYTASLTRTQQMTTRATSVTATVNVWAYFPSTTTTIKAQFCSTRKNANSSNCTTSASKTGVNGTYSTVPVSGAWPVDSASFLPTLWVTLPQGSWMNGYSIQW